VRATVIGGVVLAKEHGYFKEAGLDVDIELIDASSAFVPSLAQNGLNVVEGGVSASLFNGIQQGLPIKSAYDSTSSPINHFIMLRPDLKDIVKSIKDLKGKIVAINAPNSVASYEVTRILESAGMSINDIETKVIPFPQMGIAFKTKAIDAALEIAPFTALLPQQGLALQFINSDEIVKPQPIQISTSMFNTDWAKQNPEVAQNFFTALLRGVRDYCNAYHGGPGRAELLKLLVANGVANDVATLDALPWPARNPDGYVFRNSMADIQDWYAKQGLVRTPLPIDQVVENKFAENAVKRLGPFKLENTASTKVGCGR
jgi:NitT/TauT family transport system substrate-binding protein